MAESTNKDRLDLFGRHILTTTPPKTLDEKSVGEILNAVMPTHNANSSDVEYLRNFYRGDQPILTRTKPIRPEIKNTVLENRAFEVVEFKKGYEFSHPLVYTNVSSDNSESVMWLNDYARVDGKHAKDQILAEWMYICGTGYRMVMPTASPTVDESPFYTVVLDPRNTFVVYSNEVGGKVLFAGVCVKRKVKNQVGVKEEHRVYGIYTADHYYTWSMGEKDTDFTKFKPTVDTNTLKMIPIVEYPLNDSRLGYVELCLHLFNAINNIGSNRLDGIEQFVQALLVFINCQLPEDEEGNKVVPKSGDAVDVKSVQQGLAADVKYLTAQLDQNHAQVTKEDLLNAVYEIAGVPSRADRRSGGGDTGQAVALRDGWGAAEARARTTEKMFKKSEMDVLKLILKICRNSIISSSHIGNLTLHDIEPVLKRNRSDGMQTKAQTLQALTMSGVHPELAFEVSELFSDPVSAWKKSEEWQKTAQWVDRKMRIAQTLTGDSQNLPDGDAISDYGI